MTPHAIAIAVDTTWVVVSACLVLFMQVGFAMLEVGFSPAKNAGAVVAKVMVNLSIATLVFWAVGFALCFGSGNDLAGLHGFFVDVPGRLVRATFPALGGSDVPVAARWLFEVAFCAVSLAIVWGTMLDRTKFRAYVVFAPLYAGLLYPLVGHWIWGGGWLSRLGMQDFAGSTVVHLSGAMAALAGTLVLGPRLGRFDRHGNAQPIDGHSMPLAIFGVLILWFGWFGFNAGSTLGAIGTRFAEIAANTTLASAAGVLGALVTSYAVMRTVDVGMAGNGAIAALVAITAPCAFVRPWAALVIGVVAGALMTMTVFGVEQRLRVDDPIGAIAAHGAGGIWGTLAAGLFTTPVLAAQNHVGRAGLLYGGGLHQLAVQAVGVAAVGAFVFGASYAAFRLCQATIGLRVAAEQELEGLDLHEHGRWGLPELRLVSAEKVEHSVAPLLNPSIADTADAFDWHAEGRDVHTE